MFQFLNQYKQLLAGIVIGTVVTTAGAATAANQQVSAMIMEAVSFNFDGYEDKLPSNYKVLNYQGTTYVPVRYITETLGGTIRFENNTIYIEGLAHEYGEDDDVSTPVTPPSTTPPSTGTGSTPSPGTGTTTTPATPNDPGRTFGVYREMATQPVREVSKQNITIPATYKLESNSYATRVAGTIYNTSSTDKDVIIRAAFYDANNNLLANGIGVVNQLKSGTTKTFVVYADVKLTSVHHYELTVE